MPVVAILINSFVRELLFFESKFKGMFGEIGTVRNEADETSRKSLHF